MYNFDQYNITGSVHRNRKSQDSDVMLICGFTFILDLWFTHSKQIRKRQMEDMLYSVHKQNTVHTYDNLCTILKIQKWKHARRIHIFKRLSVLTVEIFLKKCNQVKAIHEKVDNKKLCASLQG
jgi:hypothetical protein